MLKKAAALFLVCAGLASWVGCAKTSSRYVYAAIPAANEIVAYREDPNSGVLTALSISPISAGQGVRSLLIHPSGKFLYAANSGESDISLFTISSTGALTEASRTPTTPLGTDPMFLAMDSAGSTLYAANVGSANVLVFSIAASSGALTPVGSPVSPIQLGITPLNMKVAPSGVLYVTGATGANQPGVIESITITSTGSSSQTANTGASPSGLAIDSTGSYLYAADGTNNGVWEYTINSDGSLTGIQGSPIIETYSNPLWLLIDKSNKYLYAANQNSGNVVLFGIGSGGVLSQLATAGSPFATVANPAVIGADPGGNYLFVGSQGSSAMIQSFSLDSGTGGLTAIETYHVGGSVSSIVVTQ